MKFFKLDYSLDKKIIGRAEGEKSCLFDGYRFKEDSFSNQGLFGPDSADLQSVPTNPTLVLVCNEYPI